MKTTPMYDFVEMMSIVSVICCVTAGEEWNELGYVPDDSSLRKHATDFYAGHHGSHCVTTLEMAIFLSVCQRRLALIAIDRFLS